MPRESQEKIIFMESNRNARQYIDVRQEIMPLKPKEV